MTDATATPVVAPAAGRLRRAGRFLVRHPGLTIGATIALLIGAVSLLSP